MNRKNKNRKTRKQLKTDRENKEKNKKYHAEGSKTGPYWSIEASQNRAFGPAH